MRGRAFGIVSLAAAALLLAAVPGAAVTYGERDEADAYPYVAAVVFLVDDRPAWLCSGTLISDDVLLTAAHCTAGADEAHVVFGQDWTHYLVDPAGDHVVTGTPVSHPDWNDFADYPQTYDIGVVLLDEPQDLGPYPSVAEAGYLDELVAQRGARADLRFTVVGYGLQHSQIVGGGPEGPEFEDVDDGWRHVGTVALVNLESFHSGGYNLHHTSNPGRRATGGTCYGDSGGPVLHGDTIVAVTSFGIGNLMCRGNTAFAYRVDIDSSQSFLAPYLDR